MQSRIALTLLALTLAAAGAAQAIDVPDATTGTPDAPNTSRSAQAGEDAGSDDAATGLPEECDWTSPYAYACTFTGTTEGGDVPTTPGSRPPVQELARFELPLPPQAWVNATAERADAARLFLALVDGDDNAYARSMPGDPALSHARLGVDMDAAATLALFEDGDAGGEWTVDVTVEGVLPFDVAPMGNVSRDASFDYALRSVTDSCVNDTCALQASAEERSRDLHVGELPLDGTLAVTVAHDGMSPVDVALFDAAGAEVASARVAAESSAVLETGTEDVVLGTWTLRVTPTGNGPVTVTADAVYEISEAQSRWLPPEPEPEPQPEPEPDENETAPRDDGNQTAGNDTVTKASHGPTGSASVPDHTFSVLGMPVKGPLGVLAYLGSAVAVGLLVAVTALTIAHRMAAPGGRS